MDDLTSRPCPIPRDRAAPLEIGVAPAGLDRGTWERLRSGRFRPERVLDLHGHTAQRAFGALSDFIAEAHRARLRCVEIVTGRGAGEGGVLRRELPLWLNRPELRAGLLAAAHPHPANSGAVRLLLRRARQPKAAQHPRRA